LYIDVLKRKKVFEKKKTRTNSIEGAQIKEEIGMIESIIII
jgi:hypothetical protein